MAVTRIQNNQIYSSTIVAYQKLVAGSITGNLFADSVTLNSNVSIVGNLTVSGNSTTINSVNTYVNDPLIVFNNGYSGSLSGYDIGILVNRNLSSLGPYGSVNTAWTWVENDQAFEAFATTDTGIGVTGLNNSGWANVKVGNLISVTSTINGTLTASGITTLTSGTASSAYTNGALVVTGGVGISGAINTNSTAGIGGNITITSGGALKTTQTTGYLFDETVTTLNLGRAATTVSLGATTGTTTFNSTTTSTSSSTGAVKVLGGVGVAGNVYSGAQVQANNGLYSVSTFNGGFSDGIVVDYTTGTGRISVGAADGLKVYNGGVAGTELLVIDTTGNVVIPATTTSTSATTGALVVKGGVGITGALNVTGGMGISGNMAVNGGGLTTTASTGYLFNENATTLYVGTAATSLNLGAATGTATVNNTTLTLPNATTVNVNGANPTLATTSTGTVTLFNTNATTVNAFGAATTIAIGNASGTTTIAGVTKHSGNIVAASGTASTNTTTGALVVVGGVGISGDTNSGGNATYAGDLAVNGGDITTSATTFNLVNATATTLNIGGAATALNLGAATGTTTIANPTVTLSGATTVNVNGASPTLATTSTGTLTLFNTNATTVNAFGAATTIAIGNASGTTTIAGVTKHSGNLVAAATTSTTDVNTGALVVKGGAGIAGVVIAGGNIVAASGTASTNTTTGALVVVGGVGISGALNVGGSFASAGNLAANGGGLTTTNSTGWVFNENATTLNIGAAATNVVLGSTTGTATINNPTLVGSQTTQNVYNTVATTVNAFGAATALNLGAATGTLTVGNPTLTMTNGTTLNINGSNPSIVTTSTGTASVFNTNATTLNIGGAATAVSIGASTGNTTINSQNTIVTGNLYVLGNNTIVNTETLSVEDLNITVAANATTAAQANGAGLTVAGANATFTYTSADDRWNLNKDLTVNTVWGNLNGSWIQTSGNIKSGGNIVAASGTASTNTTTGALVVVGGAGVSGALNVGSTVIAGGNIVAASGTASTNTTTGALVVVGGAGVSGALNVGSSGTFASNIADNGGGLTTTATTGYLYNENATTLNVGAAATTINVGNASGTTNLSGIFKVGGNIVATATTSTTDVNTGALVVKGGAGIAGAVIAGGNIVAASGTASTNTTTGALVVVGGAGISGALNVGGSLGVAGNMAVNGGGLTTTATTGYLYNENATTLNIGAAATTINAGNVSGTTNWSGIFKHTGNLVAASGTASTNTTTGALVVVGGAGISGDTYIGGNEVLTGDLAVNGGDITTSATTFNLVDATATTVNFARAATALTLGATSGTATLQNPTLVGTQATQNVYNTVATTVNAFGAATSLNMGAATGTTTIANPTVTLSGATALNVNGANPTIAGTSTGTLTLFNTNLTTVNAFGAATTIAIGNASGTTTISGITKSTGNLVAAATTASNDTNTGALVVKGGAGIAGVTNHGGNVVISSGTNMTSATTGALLITGSGGASIGGNVYMAQNLYIGSNALTTALANPTIVATESGSTYAQIAMLNTSGTGSADIAAYGNNGDDAGGWVDMGFTGNAFSDANYTITKANDGYVFARPKATFGGNLVIGTSEAGTYNDVVIGVGSFLSSAEVARFHGNASTNGYLAIEMPTNASPAANTGAFRVWGGASIQSNAYVGGATILGGNRQAGNDTVVQGLHDSTLIWARSGDAYDQVVIGNSATNGTLVRGAKLQINSTDSILLPVGTNAQRPSSTGGIDVTGMLRYSSTQNGLEVYNGSTWQAFTTQFTVIQSQQFNGDGTTLEFTLPVSSTSSSVIVSINGVVQIPGVAYTVVNGVTLTFTEAPVNGDVIDARMLTTTQAVSGIVSANGYMQIQLDNDGAYIYTGTSSTNLTTYWDPTGAQVSSLSNVSVASANAATTVDTIDNTKYRSAKYVIQVTSGTNYQVAEALVISNGTTATVTTYGIVQTNGNLGIISATQSGSNTLVQFTAANASSVVRIKKDYLLI